ncbi:MAG: ABC transporter ATP-binding protein [Nannocystaceae bacterium]
MLLALKGVSKRFGDADALRDVTAAVDGRAIGLLGPNGAGKTTLMRIILGLTRADSGAVEVLGINTRERPIEARAKLGYAAEGPARIPGLSGVESVAYAAELCGLDRRAALLRAHELLDLVGLGDARDRRVETYSTGMHQRVKVAMALAHDPALVLLDEPTSGLDPDSRDELLDLLVDLRGGGGPAFILSTHLLHDVERTCESCVILEGGALRFAGPLSALRRPDLAAYDVRVDGDEASRRRFVATLEGAGARIERGRRAGILVVHLARADPAAIWDAAAGAGVRIWHLDRQADALEEAFLAAVARPDAAEGSP